MIVGNDVNEFLLAVSAFGLLADAGYIAGPAGVAGNLVASVLKVVARRLDQIDPQFLLVISKQAGSMREAATALGTYFARLPKPPGMSEAEWVVEVIEASMRKLSRVIMSPIGIPIDKASEAILLLQRKGKKFYSDDAAEGVAAYLVKHAGDTAKGVEDTHDAMKASALAKGFDPETAQALADEGTESVFEAVGRYHRANASETTGLQRIDEALAAAKRPLQPSYRSVIEPFVGPNHVIKTMEEFEAIRFMRPEDLNPEQVTALNTIRQALGMVEEGTSVRKVLSVNQAIGKVQSGNAQLSGFYARSSDVFDATTTGQLVDRLRLDKQATDFPPGAPHVLMETRANAAIADNARIPRNPGFSNGSSDEYVESLPWPNTGNGMPSSRDGRVLPEYTTAPTNMDAGLDASGQPITTMSFRFDDGTAYPQTINGQTASDWMLIFDPVDPEKRKWVPVP